MSFIIKQKKEDCIGCGACTSVCPNNWEMGEDGKARPKTTELPNLDCNKDAEEICPVKCIKIEESK